MSGCEGDPGRKVFRGMQDLICKQPGVVSIRVGYAGGDVANTT